MHEEGNSEIIHEEWFTDWFIVNLCTNETTVLRKNMLTIVPQNIQGGFNNSKPA